MICTECLKQNHSQCEANRWKECRCKECHEPAEPVAAVPQYKPYVTELVKDHGPRIDTQPFPPAVAPQGLSNLPPEQMTAHSGTINGMPTAPADSTPQMCPKCGESIKPMYADEPREEWEHVCKPEATSTRTEPTSSSEFAETGKLFKTRTEMPPKVHEVVTFHEKAAPVTPEPTLSAELMDYVGHRKGCNTLNVWAEKGPCSCGLDEALKRAASVQQEPLISELFDCLSRLLSAWRTCPLCMRGMPGNHAHECEYLELRDKVKSIPADKEKS